MKKVIYSIKWSLFKYIFLMMIVGLFIYFFSYLNPEQINISSEYDTLYDIYASEGFDGRFDWFNKFMEYYYPYVEKYALIYLLVEIIINIFLLTITKNNSSKIVAGFFGIIKIGTLSLFSGFCLIGYCFSKADKKTNNEYYLMNNERNTQQQYNIQQQYNVQQQYGIQMEEKVIDTPQVRKNLYRAPSVTFASIFVFMFAMSLGCAGIIFFLGTFTIMSCVISLFCIIVGLINLFGYPNKSRIFRKCCKNIKNGYTVEEVKIVMKKFNIASEGYTMYGDYAIRYCIKESIGNDHEGMTFVFKDGILYKKSSDYRRTTYTYQ